MQEASWPLVDRLDRKADRALCSANDYAVTLTKEREGVQ
jgi:hypothetical protein